MENYKAVGKRKGDLSFEEEVLTREEVRLIGQIVNGEEVTFSQWRQALSAFCKAIKYYSFLEHSSMVYHGIDLLLSSDLSSSEKQEALLSIRDYLSNRKKRLAKEEKSERKNLSRAVQFVDMYLPTFAPPVIDKDHLLNERIVQYALEQEVPYSYLESFFFAFPECRKTMVDGEHLIVSVLRHYVESQKEELRNHKKYFLPKEYYRTFFQLLYFDSSWPLSDDEKQLIEQVREEFVDYLKERRYPQEKKEKAMFDMDQLFEMEKSSPIREEGVKLLASFKEHTKYAEQEKGRVNLTEDYLQPVKGKIDAYREEFYRRFDCYPSDAMCRDQLGLSPWDFQNASSFTSWGRFSNPYCSYAVFTSSDASSYLRMNVLDLTYYVEEGSILDQELASHPLYDFAKVLKSGSLQKIPTITYQVKVLPNGNLGDFKVYRSVSPVLREKKDYKDYREDADLKKMVAIYRKVSQDPTLEVSSYLLETFFLTLFEEEALTKGNPASSLILKGTQKSSVEELLALQDGLGSLFAKMSPRQFQIHSAFLKKNMDREHYCNADVSQGEFSLGMACPRNYIDLFNQRLLLEKDQLAKLEKQSDLSLYYQDQSDRLCQKANGELGYLAAPVRQKKKMKREN